MEKEFDVFDLHRIFIGDATALFLLEIVFRTLVMYLYTTLLLRLLGKRGMGQLSALELVIIIAFGSAVGDPMIYDDVPVLYGITAITVIALLEFGIEKMVNRYRKAERMMEGAARLVVHNCVICTDCLKKENMSKEDLFRQLRSHGVEHLGEVRRAFFETTGNISVFRHAPGDIRPGLAVLPKEEDTPVFMTGERVPGKGTFCCSDCGNCKELETGNKIPGCDNCEGREWLAAHL